MRYRCVILVDSNAKRKMPPLRSSAISFADWEPDDPDDDSQQATGTLSVTFVNGGSYDHDGVPRDVYERLVADTSPGRFYNTEIKGAY